MRIGQFIVSLIGLGAILPGASAQGSEPAPAIPSNAPYRDVALAPEKRAANVVELMTLEEKRQLVEGHKKFFIHPLERFGLRAVVLTDATAGIRVQKLYEIEAQSVAYPCVVSLSATWNRELSEAYGRSVATECKYLGFDVLLGPGFNLYRTATCGRNFEYFGEDPVLTANMVVPYIQGMQAQGTMATAKHFICNNHEWLRHTSDSIVDERALHEHYMYPWYFAVHKGEVGAVMSSYNWLNGEKVSQSKAALDGLLRTDIGFDGLLMSDWNAVTKSDEVLESGQDLVMPIIKDKEVFLQVTSGEEGGHHLDRMCQSILTQVFRFGIYDRERQTSGLVPDAERKACEQVALQTAREGITLLKNDGILPLDPKKRILLLGPDVEKTRLVGGGSGRVKGYDLTAIGPELRRLIGEERTYSEDWKTVGDQTIRDAELIVVCVDQYQRENLDQIPVLEESQNKLVTRCTALNPRTVVVVASGSGLEMEWAGSAAAILWAYFPGQYGGTALAEILTGAINPSGKLPYSIERSFSDSPAFGYHPEGASLYQRKKKDNPVDQALPENPEVVYEEGVFVGYRWYDEKNIDVRFPFGHGLSYTTFTYDKLKVKKRMWGRGITVSVTIENTGQRPGSETVQLYVGAVDPSLPRPVRELKAFAKVELASGESKKVKFQLPPVDLAFYDVESKDWKVEAGQYTIDLAASSRDIRCSKTIDWKKEMHYKRPSDALPVK